MSAEPLVTAITTCRADPAVLRARLAAMLPPETVETLVVNLPAGDPAHLAATFEKRVLALELDPAGVARVLEAGGPLATAPDRPQFKDLPEGLPPVPAFETDLLPPRLRRRVDDLTERMQVPADFPAVALMVAIAGMVGRRCGIAPLARGDWYVVPNLWGAIIGTPGVLKTPALLEVLKPIRALQAAAIEEHEHATRDFEARGILGDIAAQVAKEAIKKALKSGQKAAAEDLAQGTVEAAAMVPICRRYLVNDCTVEKLGELLKENPHGLLLFRDELAGFFRGLERQGHEADRAFYLEAWNGSGSFTYDRIGRGTVHVPAACVSILGSIQPGPLSQIVRGMRGGGDDGLIQRFQLLAWPDTPRTWRRVDRDPDHHARDDVDRLFRELDQLTPTRVGADPGEVPLLRFDSDSQALWDTWHESLENRLRSGTEAGVIEAHLAKYRSLVPSLALLVHLCDQQEGPVPLLALERAVAWAEYLEPHARRVYAPITSSEMDSARELAKRIRSGSLPAEFALRDVYRNGWTGLVTREEAQQAVEVLMDHDWLTSRQDTTEGRPKTVYVIHPDLRRAAP